MHKHLLLALSFCALPILCNAEDSKDGLLKYSAIRAKLVAQCDILKDRPANSTVCNDGASIYSFYRQRTLIGSFADYLSSPHKECSQNYSVGNKPVACKEFYQTMDRIEAECNGCVQVNKVFAGG